jgi:hypothetical protein
MLTWFNVVRYVGLGLLVTACAGIAIWVIANEFRDMLRRVGMIETASNLGRWAGKNGYTILFQEQVSDGSITNKGGPHIAFRVVVQDQQGERRWAWISSGRRFEVRWIKAESWFALSSAGSPSSDVEPLWDRELDT